MRAPVRLSILVVLALGLATACGDAPANDIVHVVDHPERGRHRLSDGVVERAVLADASRLAADDWWPVVRVDGPPSPEAEAAFLDGAAVGDDELRIGPTEGGWLHVVPVDPGLDLQLTATVEARGLRVGDISKTASGSRPGARIGIVEFTSVPKRDRLREVGIAAAIRQEHWSPSLADDRSAELIVSMRTRPRTQAVGILCSQPLSLPSSEAGASFRSLRLVRPGVVDWARSVGHGVEVSDDGAGTPVGRFAIGNVDRPSVVVVPGARVTVPVGVPEDAPRFETFAGLAPYRHFALDVPATLRCEVQLDGEVVAEWSAELATQSVAHSRWRPLGGPLPETTWGRDVELVFTSSAPEGALCLPVFGDPRLVPASPPRRGPNVVVVSLDTLRADRLGCYGYERDTSPRLDELAASSILFEDVWSQGPYTLPTHMTLFSGQFPSVHGIQSDPDRLDPVRTRLLAELLRERGYTTAGFTGGGFLHPDFGFARGFDTYVSQETLLNKESALFHAVLDRIPGQDASTYEDHGVEIVEEWIEAHANETFLLFFHTYAAHQFDPPEEHVRALGLDVGPREAKDEFGHYLSNFDEPPAEIVRGLSDLYDASVHQVDEAVGRLLDTLDRLGLTDDTIVVVTSDHGKELGERGLVAHGHSLYEELLKIPLIVRVPGEAPRRVRTPVMLVDVLPTILGALGIEPPHLVQGQDLLGPIQERPLFAEVTAAAVKAALRRGTLKTIYSPLDAVCPIRNTIEEQSFDLGHDPGEHSALTDDDRRDDVIRFQRSLRELGESLAGGATEAGALSPEAAAHLRELGYVVGGDG